MTEARTGDGGTCFNSALDDARSLMVGLGRENVFVVHGLPIGRGVRNAGKRYWHAWVEGKLPDGTWAVKDYQVQGLIDRKTYYLLGQIQQHLLWRYGWRDIIANCAELQHAGPWRADPVGIEIV